MLTEHRLRYLFLLSIMVVYFFLVMPLMAQEIIPEETNVPEEVIPMNTDNETELAYEWDEVERLIMGLERETYYEIYQNDPETKLTLIKEQKKDQDLAITLSSIPGINFAGVQFYYNGDWKKGVVSNIFALASPFLIIYFMEDDIILNDAGNYIKNLGLYFTPAILTSWFVYGLFYSLYDVEEFNRDLDRRINNLVQYYQGDNIDAVLKSEIDALQQRKKDTDLAVIFAAIPFTNWLGLHFYYTDNLLQAFTTHLLTTAPLVQLGIYGITCAINGDNTDDPYLQAGFYALNFGILGLWYFYGLFYTLVELDNYNALIQEDIEKLEVLLKEDSMYSFLKRMNFAVIPEPNGLMTTISIYF